MSYFPEADLWSDSPYIMDANHRASTLYDDSVLGSRFDPTSIRSSDSYLYADGRMYQQEYSLNDPNLLGLGNGSTVDSGGRFGEVIDDIIKPKKPKTRGRSKSRSERSVSCEQCTLIFTSVGNLNRHRRVTHEGQRVFCKIKGCDKSFSQTADLTRHRKRVHKYNSGNSSNEQGQGQRWQK